MAEAEAEAEGWLDFIGNLINSSTASGNMITIMVFIAMLVVFSFHVYTKWLRQSDQHRDHGDGGHHLDDDECVVCLSKVFRGEKLRVLPICKHGFHLHCIDAWLKLHSTCPLCRIYVTLTPPLPHGHGHDDDDDGLFSSLLSLIGSVGKWMDDPLNSELSLAAAQSFGYH